MSKFWNFIHNAATETSEESVELRITGNITDDENAWIYDWFGVPVASPNAFRKELSKYKGKNIKVWIDSYGGSVFAGAGIYNALKAHDGKVTTIVDGKAMSAASVIAMAGDEILMSPVGIMMVHNPLTRAEGDARVMRKAADVLDTVKDTIMNAYQAKTGKSRNKIAEMMDDETWMSANMAVKEGFADKVLYSEKEAKPVENSFSFSHMDIQNSLNDSIKSFFEIAKISETQNNNEPSAPQAAAQEQTPVANITNTNPKGEKKIMNVEELRITHPDLVAQIENNAKAEGAKEERQRIKDIEAISNTIVPALVNKAKFEEPMNAEKLAFEAMKQNAQKGQEYLQNVATETQNSGAQTVVAAANNPTATGEQKPKTLASIIDNAGAKFERTRKGEK